MTLWPLLAPVIGYAIGTSQVVLLDWHRARLKHRRDLRLLRAEVVRVLGFSAKFDYGRVFPPKNGASPIVPAFTSKFLDTAIATDFELTDEFDDDNSQLSFLMAGDHCALLKRYADMVNDVRERVGPQSGPLSPAAAGQHLSELMEAAGHYDDLLDLMRAGLFTMLDDVDRRIAKASFSRQAWNEIELPARRLLHIPRKGENPRGFDIGDPRIAEILSSRELISPR